MMWLSHLHYLLSHMFSFPHLTSCFKDRPGLLSLLISWFESLEVHLRNSKFLFPISHVWIIKASKFTDSWVAAFVIFYVYWVSLEELWKPIFSAMMFDVFYHISTVLSWVLLCGSGSSWGFFRRTVSAFLPIPWSNSVVVDRQRNRAAAKRSLSARNELD